MGWWWVGRVGGGSLGREVVVGVVVVRGRW